MTDEIFLTAAIWLFALAFFVIARIRRKRARVLPSLLIVIFVTFSTLLSPSGEVLATVGSFRITLGSLLLGLRRSGILIGTVFLSRSLVPLHKEIPPRQRFGRLGNSLTEIFHYLNLLTEQKIPLKRGHIIEAIDRRLCEIWGEEEA